MTHRRRAAAPCETSRRADPCGRRTRVCRRAGRAPPLRWSRRASRGCDRRAARRSRARRSAPRRCDRIRARARRVRASRATSVGPAVSRMRGAERAFARPVGDTARGGGERTPAACGAKARCPWLPSSASTSLPRTGRYRTPSTTIGVACGLPAGPSASSSAPRATGTAHACASRATLVASICVERREARAGVIAAVHGPVAGGDGGSRARPRGRAAADLLRVCAHGREHHRRVGEDGSQPPPNMGSRHLVTPPRSDSRAKRKRTTLRSRSRRLTR